MSRVRWLVGAKMRLGLLGSERYCMMYMEHFEKFCVRIDKEIILRGGCPYEKADSGRSDSSLHVGSGRLRPFKEYRGFKVSSG